MMNFEYLEVAETCCKVQFKHLSQELSKTMKDVKIADL